MLTSGTSRNVTISDLASAQRELRALSTAPAANALPLTITVNALAAGAAYEFAHEEFKIHYKNLTIVAASGGSVVFRNIQLSFDLDVCEMIRVESIAFFSDGTFAAARDGIELSPMGTPPTPAPNTISVMIAHCAFDGYFDIAIDSRVRTDGPFLHATIDSCLFFDRMPGMPKTTITQGGKQVYVFVNRGAINVSSVVHNGKGNSLFTIARNVFIDVWRRVPRVAEGNQAHFYNNLLFRWGIGDETTDGSLGTREWTGTVTDNQGQAVIQANRYIPWQKKLQANRTIGIGPDTIVDLGKPARQTGITAEGHPIGTPDTRNEFNGANGASPAPAGLPPVSDRIRDIDVYSWYSSHGLQAPFGVAQPASWIALLDAAGPPSLPRTAITQVLRKVLTDAAAGSPAIPPD
jgi:hypothetical protein